jgi:RimJ/RimL family protein N-acetyltransferase
MQQVEGIMKSWAESQKQFHLAVALRESEEVIGHANVNWRWDAHCPDIDVVIAPEHQHRGYGGEVLELLLSYLFGYTQAHSVGSGMASWNQGALKFALVHGFQQTGAMRRVGLHQGKYFDWIAVDILRPEWQTQRGGE